MAIGPERSMRTRTLVFPGRDSVREQLVYTLSSSSSEFPWANQNVLSHTAVQLKPANNSKSLRAQTALLSASRACSTRSVGKGKLSYSNESHSKSLSHAVQEEVRRELLRLRSQKNSVFEDWRDEELSFSGGAAKFHASQDMDPKRALLRLGMEKWQPTIHDQLHPRLPTASVRQHIQVPVDRREVHKDGADYFPARLSTRQASPVRVSGANLRFQKAKNARPMSIDLPVKAPWATARSGNSIKLAKHRQPRARSVASSVAEHGAPPGVNKKAIDLLEEQLRTTCYRKFDPGNGADISVRKVFRHFDSDKECGDSAEGGHGIDKTEFIEAIQRLMLGDASRGIVSQEEAAALFERIDTDKSGTIDYRETALQLSRPGWNHDKLLAPHLGL